MNYSPFQEKQLLTTPIISGIYTAKPEYLVTTDELDEGMGNQAIQGGGEGRL